MQVERLQPGGLLHRHRPQVQRSGLQFSRQRRALGIVDVEHRGLQAGPAEQAALGRPVGGHAAVVVQVVAAEVGELRHPQRGAGQALLDQADRRGLDGAGHKAGVDHGTQAGVQGHRVGRGQAGVGDAAGVAVQRRLAVAEGAHHAAALAQRGQGLGGPPGGAALAVGAGGSHHRQRLGGLAEPGRGQRAGGGLQAWQAGDAGVVEGKGGHAVSLHQAGRRASRQGAGHMPAAVGGSTRPGDEGIAGAHRAAVGAQRAGTSRAHPCGQPIGGLGNGVQGLQCSGHGVRSSPARRARPWPPHAASLPGRAARPAPAASAAPPG